MSTETTAHLASVRETTRIRELEELSGSSTSRAALTSVGFMSEAFVLCTVGVGILPAAVPG